MTNSPQPAPSDQVASHRRRFDYPAGLLAFYLLAQLLVLAWSAYPARTMRGQQPRESWMFLAGVQALFLSWCWPMVRTRGASWRQTVVEAVLLVAASVPAIVPAAAWVDASAGHIVSACAYSLLWLLAAAAAIECGTRWIVRWGFGAVTGLANFALLGLGYLWRDLLLAEAWPAWRFSPMACAARLAATGWPTGLADRLAALVPAILFVALLSLRLLIGRGKERLSEPRPGF